MNTEPARESEETIFFQTGLTGSTGYVLSFNPVHPVILSKMNKPQMNADERRLIKSAHRKGHEERKVSKQKSKHSINNELVRTDTNSSNPEFVRVRISSLFNIEKPAAQQEAAR